MRYRQSVPYGFLKNVWRTECTHKRHNVTCPICGADFCEVDDHSCFGSEMTVSAIRSKLHPTLQQEFREGG